MKLYRHSATVLRESVFCDGESVQCTHSMIRFVEKHEDSSTAVLRTIVDRSGWQGVHVLRLRVPIIPPTMRRATSGVR